MHLQSMIVALLVIGCSGYAAWSLMPSAARRALAGSLAKLPLPDAMVSRLRATATTASGCGCDGCDRSEAKRPGSAKIDGAQVIVVHRRR